MSLCYFQHSTHAASYAILCTQGSSGSANCLNVYTVETTPTSSMETVVHGPLIPAIISANTLTVSIESNLAPNNVYTALVITVNVLGSVNSTGMIQFSK